MLVQLSICPECAMAACIMVLLLQIGVNARLTLRLMGATKYYIHQLRLSAPFLLPLE